MNRAWIPIIAICFATGPAWADSAAQAPEHLHILGWVEQVEVVPEGIRLKAKMDTGATTSSMNALNKKVFKRDGKDWIAFDIIDPKNKSRTVRIERQIVRYTRILRHDGNHQRRPVVLMGFCMGDIYREAEVSLIDRTQLTYQALVGRNHLRGAVVVDPSRRTTQTPRCDLPEDAATAASDEEDAEKRRELRELQG